MSLTQAWQQALQSLSVGRPPQDPSGALLHSAEAYSVLTQFLEPSPPQTSRFYDEGLGRCILDSSSAAALEELLSSNASTSKLDLSAPNPALVALSNHYVDRCLQMFESTAEACGVTAIDESGKAHPILGEDLPNGLSEVSAWFNAWLSPYSAGSIFQALPNHRDDLLQGLQSRLRSYFDRSAAKALQNHLEQLIVSHHDVDLHSAFVAHLSIAGLSSTALSLLTRVMHAEIARKVRAVLDACDPRPHDDVLPLESPARPILQGWLDNSLKTRYSAIRHLCYPSPPPHEDDSSWQQQLDYQLDKALCLTRANQLFDLVAMYPDSSPALEDLRLSLQTADQRLTVASTLSSSLQMRLLHPGAHTRDIIQMYVHLVRALREVDPTGVVLSRVVSPLRRHLRGRKDTVRVIVGSMLGDDEEFTLLKDELERADAEEQELEGEAEHKRKRRPRRSLQTAPAASTGKSGKKSKRGRGTRRRGEGSDSDASSNEDEDWDDPNWVPKPVDAGSGYRLSTSKDIISMLTSIFDDRTGFISALEKSMADQLVQVKGYKAMKEYRNNMILKKRFGERNMGKCDVMLGDVTESRRIDAEVHQRRRKSRVAVEGIEGMVSRLHPLVVSRQFWPEITTKPAPTPTAGTGVGEFTLPPLFKHAQDEYSKTYSQAKAMRKLHWLNHLGTVELDVELDSGESVSVECSLIQASTLEVISRRSSGGEGKGVVTLTDVMEELNLQREKDGRDALEFWVQVGLLRPVEGVGDAFMVQSSLPARANAVEEDEEEEEAL